AGPDGVVARDACRRIEREIAGTAAGMKFLRTAVVGAALLAGAYLWNEQATSPEFAPEDSGAVATEGRGTSRQDALLADAFDDRRRSYQVEGSGEVVRLLSDDRDGSRHQRFILRTGSGQTLLVAHNIDLAPRVE